MAYCPTISQFATTGRARRASRVRPKWLQSPRKLRRDGAAAQRPSGEPIRHRLCIDAGAGASDLRCEETRDPEAGAYLAAFPPSWLVAVGRLAVRWYESASSGTTTRPVVVVVPIASTIAAIRRESAAEVSDVSAGGPGASAVDDDEHREGRTRATDHRVRPGPTVVKGRPIGTLRTRAIADSLSGWPSTSPSSERSR
jgi:hypothetical protein